MYSVTLNSGLNVHLTGRNAGKCTVYYARFIGKILAVSKLRLLIKHLAASHDLSYAMESYKIWDL